MDTRHQTQAISDNRSTVAIRKLQAVPANVHRSRFAIRLRLAGLTQRNVLAAQVAFLDHLEGRDLDLFQSVRHLRKICPFVRMKATDPVLHRHNRML
jgi:hypothetical protein